MHAFPIVQPTKFDLSINLKTSKSLGLQAPDKLLALADDEYMSNVLTQGGHVSCADGFPLLG